MTSFGIGANNPINVRRLVETVGIISSNIHVAQIVNEKDDEVGFVRRLRSFLRSAATDQGQKKYWDENAWHGQHYREPFNGTEEPAGWGRQMYVSVLGTSFVQPVRYANRLILRLAAQPFAPKRHGNQQLT